MAGWAAVARGGERVAAATGEAATAAATAEAVTEEVRGAAGSVVAARAVAREAAD